MNSLLVMLVTILMMCAVCLLFVLWVLKQPMPDAVDSDEELDDERAQKRRY
ncbi:hypothetical protein [Ralstonia solanacearum]|uniref:hypothetical protein n=1 Tax=Ralstonia solanacearum TaxID=305 RepID=UPI0015F98AA1|nr:hypothetical protein [Ralstonia solanacearum]